MLIGQGTMIITIIIDSEDETKMVEHNILYTMCIVITILRSIHLWRCPFDWNLVFL